MRDIKFRVWDKNIKTFAYDNFYVNPNGSVAFYWQPKQFNSASSILMQFSGMKDKNGKEIYEGDLCKRNGHLYEIYFSEGAFGIKRTNDTAAQITNMYHGHALYNYISEMEVVGNIYEDINLILGLP